MTASGCAPSPRPTCRGSSRASATPTPSTGWRSCRATRARRRRGRTWRPSRSGSPRATRSPGRSAPPTTTGCSASWASTGCTSRAGGRLLGAPRGARPGAHHAGRGPGHPARVRVARARPALGVRLRAARGVTPDHRGERHCARPGCSGTPPGPATARRSTSPATTCWPRSSARSRRGRGRRPTRARRRSRRPRAPPPRAPVER